MGASLVFFFFFTCSGHGFYSFEKKSNIENTCVNTSWFFSDITT